MATGELLNCNADVAAGALAGALDAELLVLLSDVDQLRAIADDASSALAAVSGDDVRRLIDSGAAREGMRPKMTAALDALEGGAARCCSRTARGPRAARRAGRIDPHDGGSAVTRHFITIEELTTSDLDVDLRPRDVAL